MTREEILAVTESDTKGCEAINKAVHEKLGLCWHEYEANKITGWSICLKCRKTRFNLAAFCNQENPDYTHDIRAAWAINKWLDKNDSSKSPNTYLYEKYESLVYVHGQHSVLWASALDRCKAFLLME